MDIDEINSLQDWLEDLASVEIEQRFTNPLPHENPARMIPEWEIEAEIDGRTEYANGRTIFEAIKNLKMIIEGKAEQVLLSGGYFGGRYLILPIEYAKRGRVRLPIPSQLSVPIIPSTTAQVDMVSIKTVDYVDGGGCWCAQK